MTDLIEVVVETIGPDGEVTHTELVQRHTLASEAQHTAANMRRSIPSERLDRTHRVVVRPYREEEGK